MAEALATAVAGGHAEGVATSAQALLVVDDDCACVEASLGACRMLGLARAEVVGRSLADLLEPASRERFGHVWRAFRDGGGQAEPFALAGPAAHVPMAIRVTAQVLPERHLIRFEPRSGGAAQPAPALAAVAEPEPAPPAPRTGARQPTARERQVLGLLATGSTDGQIAQRLELSPATVQTHVRNAKAKLGARTRAQAVALAIQRGLIATD